MCLIRVILFTAMGDDLKKQMSSLWMVGCQFDFLNITFKQNKSLTLLTLIPAPVSGQRLNRRH